MRTSDIKRKTAETDVSLTLNLDGRGISTVNTGCGFLDHMLTLFAKHARFDLEVTCSGDVQVDYHHTTEDIAICLGMAFARAIDQKRGIRRYGDTLLPMDESLILSALDISGRGESYYELSIPTQKVGDFDTELCEEFWSAFARNAGITLHLRQLSGKNSHHIIEGAFKSVARSLRTAVSIDPEFAEDIPSTKGTIA